MCIIYKPCLREESTAYRNHNHQTTAQRGGGGGGGRKRERERESYIAGRESL